MAINMAAATSIVGATNLVHQTSENGNLLLSNSGGAVYKVNTVLAFIQSGQAVTLYINDGTKSTKIAHYNTDGTSQNVGMRTLINRDTPIYLPEGYSLTFSIGGSFSLGLIDRNHVTVSYEIIS